MGWFDKWFDNADWPHDARLDPFRDGVWQLAVGGETKGWLTTSVSPMRSFPFFWDKQEAMWSQVHLLDGRTGRLEEDYGPDWYSVEELLDGRFVTSQPHNGVDVAYDASAVHSDERVQLWERLKHGTDN